MVIKTIVHFEIPAGDVERLSRFYRESFGWKFEKMSMPGMDYWLVSTGPRGKSIGGGMYKRLSENDKPRNFIAVDNIDKAIEGFKTAGGSEVVGKMEVPKMGWTFIGADPEGNPVGLWQAMAQPRRARRRPARRKQRGRRSRR